MLLLLGLYIWQISIYFFKVQPFFFNALIKNGHSVVVVEHNLDLIKCADHLIELGPKAGKEGGEIVAQGTPEEVAEINNAASSKYLKEKLLA